MSARTDCRTKLAAAMPWDQGAPQINGSSLAGARRGAPFFYPVPVSGERPCLFNAEGLPEGININPATGIMTGRCAMEGDFPALISVTNPQGRCTKKIMLCIGEQICLTPPMGWNSWNCWGAAIDEARVRQSAQQLIASGLAAHGFNYVNIDDGWQGERGGPLNALQPNAKFKDMQGLCADLHALGLRIGIYSTPWKKSYAGYNGGSSGPCTHYANVADRENDRGIGQISHHREDARQWAQWGFDYLKYDWRPWEVADVQAMQAALRACGRDIVYSLSNSAPFEQAAEWARRANVWRTTGDITDTWASVSGIGFAQDRWIPYAAPGHWNDPDMLVVGRLGWGEVRENRLTRDEQITHITLWCLLAAPLLLGCDLAALDEFTLQLLANDDVLAVDQEPASQPAHCVRDLRKTAPNGETILHESIYKKTLSDGSIVVGLFNRSEQPRMLEVDWAELGLQGFHSARDLWAREELGKYSGRLAMGVPVHGAQLLRLKT